MNLKNIFRSVILFTIIIGLIISCDNKQALKDAVSETLGTTIFTLQPSSDSIRPRFTLIRYVENPGCTSCQLQLGQWRVYRKKLELKYKDAVRLSFVVKSDNLKELDRVLGINKFDDITVVDSLGLFRSTNNLNKILGKDIVMLLDSTDKVLCMGNPCEDEVIDSIYESMFLKILY